MSRNPFANASQILDGNPAPGAFGRSNDTFRDNVILVASEVGFLLRQTLQLLLRSLRVSPLESLSLEVVFPANVLHRFATVDSSIAVCSKVDDAKINTDEIFDSDRNRNSFLDLDVKIVASVSMLA